MAILFASGSTWNTASNWGTTTGASDGTVPGSGDVATFDTNSVTMTVDTTVDVSGINITAAFANTLDFNDNAITIGAGDFVLAAGTLDLGSGTIISSGDWTISGGTFNEETSTVQFNNPGAGGGTITGSETFNNVTFNHNDTQSRTQTIAGGTTITVAGNLVFSNSNVGVYAIDGGDIVAKGDVTFDDQRYNGTTTITINDTDAQELSGSHVASLGNTPNITINKASGTLTISGTLRVTANWTHTAGTLNATGTIVFGPPGAGGSTITGSHTLNNVTFDQNDTQERTWTINSGDTMTVAGAMIFTNDSSGQTNIDDGTIAAQGSITVDEKRFAGSGALLINGTGDQTFTGTATDTTGNIISVTINKSSGTLTLSGKIRTAFDWTHTAGTISEGSSTIVFADPASGGGTITGSHTIGNIRFDQNNNQVRTWTINSGDTLTASGDVTIDNSNAGGAAISVSTGTLDIKGNLTCAAEASGNAAIILSGSSDQNVSLASVPSGTITVTNTGGTIISIANFVATTTGQDLIINAGARFCSGGFDVTVDDLITNNGTFQKFAGDTISPDPGNTITVTSCGIQDMDIDNVVIGFGGNSFLQAGKFER